MAGGEMTVRKGRKFVNYYEHFPKVELERDLKAPVRFGQPIQREDEDNEKRLLQIFPEEIWLLIMGRMEEPRDFENIANSSAFFRTLLETRRTEYLFPHVLPILAPGLGFAFGEVQMTSDLFYQALQNERGRSLKWYSTLLRMRPVCQSWNKSIDHYFQAHRLHYKMTHDQCDQHQDNRENPDKFAKMMSTYQFKYLEPGKLDSFLEHFKVSHKDNLGRSPFIGGYVCLVDDQSPRWGADNLRLSAQEARDRSERLRNKFTELLEKYGHHVWNARIEIKEKFVTQPMRLDYLKRMRYWLELMPNLRVLQFEYFRHAKGMYAILKPPKNYNDHQVLQELEGELGAKGFPRLEHLAFLKMEALPVPVFNNLLANNDHVPKLEVKWKKTYAAYNFGTLSNLKQFSFPICSERDVQKLDELGPQLQNLTKLHLPCTPAKYVSFEEWVQYLQVVCKHWRNNRVLEDLALQIPRLRGNSSNEHLAFVKRLKLHLPPVKRLKFIMDIPCSLQWLLPLKQSLETLHLFVHYKQLETYASHFRYPLPVPKLEWKKKQTGSVDWLGFEDKAHESNMWHKFPKLNRVNVEGMSNVSFYLANRTEYFRCAGDGTEMDSGESDDDSIDSDDLGQSGSE